MASGRSCNSDSAEPGDTRLAAQETRYKTTSPSAQVTRGEIWLGIDHGGRKGFDPARSGSRRGQGPAGEETGRSPGKGAHRHVEDAARGIRGMRLRHWSGLPTLDAFRTLATYPSPGVRAVFQEIQALASA